MKKRFYISAIFLIISLGLSTIVYANSSGPNNPAAAIDDASIGTEVWKDPGNVTASDDKKATVRVDDFETSHYIKATDFGFSIPSDAVIGGVVVEVERRVSSNVSGSIVKDASVKLVKGGVIAGEDRATGTSYTNKDINESHGSATDLWGISLMPADVNDEDFGAAVAVTKTNDPGGSREARIDNIRITVHFSIPEEANLREIKINIFSDLIELQNNASAEHDKRRFGMAIRSLNKSLDDELWADSMHLSSKGEAAFKKERKAVKELQNTMKSKKSLRGDAQLEDFINRVLDVDRNLALIAIEDAEDEGEEKFIKKANEQIELGDEAASGGRFRGAINHYLHAWKFARKAVE